MMLKQTVSDSRNVKIVIAVIVLGNALFLLSMPLLPFIDLPNHLAEATIFRDYGEEGNVLSSYYKPAPLYFPNTFHTVFCSLFANVELGNKVFHILCIALLQVSVFIVIRQLGGNLWYGLLATLFTYNYNLTYGFVGFAISTPTLILLFYLILRDFEKNTLALKIGIALLLIMLFLMHAQNALLGLVLFGFMTLYHFQTSIRQIILRGLLIPLPLIVLIFAWWFNRDRENEQSTSGYLLEYYKNHYLPDFLMRFRIVVFDNFQLREGAPGLIIAAAFFLAILIPIVWFKPWRHKSAVTLLMPKYVYPIIFFLTTFLCYLFLPDQLPGQSPLFQRLCTIVILSFIIFSSVWLRDVATKGLVAYVIAFVVVYNAMWFEYVYSFNRENREFNASLFNGLPNHARMAGLIYDHKYRGRKVYIHFPNYFLVWRKGIAASKIIDYRFGVVRRVAHESEVPFYTEYIGDGYKVIPAYQQLEYLLVRGEAPVSPDSNVSSFRKIREAGEWSLFERHGR